MDNEKLARFITNLGRFNDYGSTISQTKAALDTKSLSPLRDDNDDRVIFEDALRAIETVKELPFSAESIVTVNRQFKGDSSEQPYHPGRLRDGLQDPIRDHIHVNLWPGENEVVRYYPPLVVELEDLEPFIKCWENSSKSDFEAWKLFARLAKLQPFQDGNKRTALISVNHALGALLSQDYLMPPAGREYNRFMDGLLGYYGVGLEGGEKSEATALHDFLQVVPQRHKTLDKERTSKQGFEPEL